MKYNSIGIIGGFGAFATLDFFGRLLVRFRSDCERNYPRIVMDNNFRMPSRTKSLLDGSGRDDIVQAMARSMRLMLREDVEKIIMVCGAAHCFLDDVFDLVPEAEARLLHIVDALGADLQSEQIHDAVVLAAEGTLSQNLYGLRLKKFDVNCISPSEQQYPILRSWIESVKQNNFDEQTLLRFIRFLSGFPTSNVILGCTELPVLVSAARQYPVLLEQIEQYCFWDPLESVLNSLE